MTIDAIREIKNAEENGAQLIINSQIESKYRIEKVSEELENTKLEAEKKFKGIFNAKISLAYQKANLIASEEEQKAKADAEVIENSAKSKIDGAVDIIIEEIKSLWQ